jgi:hypothetical protein
MEALRPHGPDPGCTVSVLPSFTPLHRCARLGAIGWGITRAVDAMSYSSREQRTPPGLRVTEPPPSC